MLTAGAAGLGRLRAQGEAARHFQTLRYDPAGTITVLQHCTLEGAGGPAHHGSGIRSAPAAKTGVPG